MSKLVTLTAAAIGFVLGSRAGREPYEKLAEQAGRVRRDQRVQEKVGQARDTAQAKAKEAAATVTHKAGEKISSATSGASADSSTPAGQHLGQAGAGPQGDLP